MKDHEIVEKTADIAEGRGICAGALEDATGQVCSEGALITALYGGTSLYQLDDNLNEVNRISERIADALSLPLTRDRRPYASCQILRVADWNDSCVLGTYRGEHPNVLDGLRYAAKAIRTQDEDSP